MATDVKELLKRLEDGVREIQGSEQWRRLLKAQANSENVRSVSPASDAIPKGPSGICA